eukprot:TRINITY_DN22496_c0_g1_i3.p2 TRINITY_DN22496_c0_g1~~TRINITY_DN22496_c0_g1_i3.p2  ORF type:complete len:162 (-),score=36.75 TRINITY_DN22496_c0_g1_i3:429-914(-)
MDHGGPVPEGHLREPVGEREYTLQRVAVLGGRGDDRLEPLSTLQNEEEFAALFKSDTKVILLEAYCALAPRERVKQHGLGEIIQEELAGLLRRAKEQGVTVVFHVGGEDPVALAEKVYQKPHLVEIGGLRCGYLRWRQGPNRPWEALRSPSVRLILGVQFG